MSESTQLEIKRAVRCGVIPLIGINGRTSSGKTKSALMIARGIVGPSGKICGVDSENGRMSHFADDSSIGGFDVIDLQPPFSPKRYYAAITAAIDAKYGICVVDSASHEWVSEGGSLDFREQWLDKKCGDDWAKRDKMNMLSWNEVAKERAPFLNLILRCPIPLILCFRVKNKIVMPKDDPPQEHDSRRRPKEKFSIQEDAPVSRADLTYEMMWVAHVEAIEEKGGGFFRIQKPGPDSLRKEVEAVGGDRIMVEHGAAIARWCKGTTNPSNTGQTGKKTESPLDIAKKKLWKSMTDAGAPEDKIIREVWLRDKKIIGPAQTMAELSIAELEEATRRVEVIIQENQS
jgi:hypothetical protein